MESEPAALNDAEWKKNYNERNYDRAWSTLLNINCGDPLNNIAILQAGKTTGAAISGYYPCGSIFRDKEDS